MSKSPKPIYVDTHVSNDLLHNAAYFSTFEKVVWEYVSNSLDAAKDDRPVNVVVKLDSKSLSIRDDGRGMSREELSNFFQMHGENIQRKRGKSTRGKFGTGKCAAFGLANAIEIDTVQSGKRNVVALSKHDIKSAAHGSRFPVEDKVVDEATSEADGTLVTVRGFVKGKKPKTETVLKFIERHLNRHKGRATVYIDGIECEFKEPAHRSLYNLPPPSNIVDFIGEVELVIKVAGTPLSREEQGIAIYSRGIWHETFAGDIGNGEHAKYIFGEVDVPMLEDGNSEIPAFDNTRSMQLKDDNPAVARLKWWIGDELKKVHAALLKEADEKRQSAQAKRLRRAERQIAKLLNEDFAELETKLDKARRATSKAGSMATADSEGDEGVLPGDGDIPTDTTQAGHERGEDGGGGSDAGEGETPRPGPSLIDGEDKGKKTGQTEGNRRRRSGGFSVRHENAAAANPRSRYESESKTIYINLDHIQIDRALQASKGNTNGAQFREMTYEVAAIEYSLALEHERAGNDEVKDPEDTLYNMRETINRVTRKFAEVLNS